VLVSQRRHYPSGFLLLVTPILVFIALQAAYIRAPEVGIDFAVFRTMAERLSAGEPIYRFDEVFAFKYSPFAAMVLSPLGLFAPLVAYWLWNLWNALALSCFIAWLPAPRAPLLLAFLAMAAIVQHHFALGQIDASLFALWALSERLKDDRPVLSGALLGALPFFKLPLLLLWFLTLRSPRRLTGLCVGMAFCGLSPFAVFGVDGAFEMYTTWWQTLGGSTKPILCWPDNQGAFGLPCAFGLEPGTPLFSTLGLTFGAIVLWVSWRTPLGLLFASQFLSPLSWYTTWLSALGFVALAIASKRWWIFVLLVPAALASRDVYGAELFRRFLDLRMYGFLYTPIILYGAYRHCLISKE
jgi:hypothetical protein